MHIKHANECDCERCDGGTAAVVTGVTTYGGSMCLCPCHHKERNRKEAEQLRIDLERVKRQFELAVSGIFVNKTIEWKQCEQDLVAVRAIADQYRRENDYLKEQIKDLEKSKESHE